MSEILKSFLKHERALKKYLSRFFSGSEDIDDLAQDVFLKAYATELRTEVRAPKLLLFRAAKHIALNHLARKSNKTTDHIEDLGGPAVFLDGDQIGAEDLVDSKRKLLVFSKAVASLPPNCREVFILRKFEGLSNKEIAKRLKISISGVEKHIATGIVKCSQYLRDMGYGPGEFGSHNTIRLKTENARSGDLSTSKNTRANDE